MPLPSPSRRTVVGAAAWSVPAVVAATAAPAFAISPNNPSQLPPGADFDWVAGIQINRQGTNAFWVNQRDNQILSFDLYSGSSLVPAGSYFTDVKLTVSWSASASLTPSVVSNNGWIVLSGGVAGESGEIVLAPAGPLYNSQPIVLPVVKLAPTDSAQPPQSGTGSIDAVVDGTNMRPTTAATWI